MNAINTKKTWLCLLAGMSLLGGPCFAGDQSKYLSSFPEGRTPQEIGLRVTQNLLSRDHMLTTFLRNNKPGSIHYAEIVTAYGALGFADLTNDRR